MAADGFGDRSVIGRHDRFYTARQLLDVTISGAAAIRAVGDRSVVYLDVNGVGFTIALFAAARAGVPLVPLNYRLGDEQLRALLRKHPGAVGVASTRFEHLFRQVGVPVWTNSEWAVAGAGIMEGGLLETDTRENPVAIIYTSGTTSEPKGVLLSHSNLMSYVVGTVDFGSAEPEDASLISVPPYHIAAIAAAATNLYAGRRCVVLEQFSGEEWLDTVRREKVTHAVVVP